jgi:two-component sensor histidine kinase
MTFDENNESLRRPAAQPASGIAEGHAERDLLQAQQQLVRRTGELARSEAQLRSALKAGRLVHWETDLAAGVRHWTPEAMALFGLDVPGGRGRFGGDGDEFFLAVHPDDRHMTASFYELANRQDWFPVEYRIVKPDGSVRWLAGGGEVVARLPDGRAARLVNVVGDITDRKLAEQHTELIMRELTHRAKNLLAVILSIATQTSRSANTVEEFHERFSSRLQGLAASHDLLVHRDWQGASIGEIAESQLAPFVDAGTDRLHLSGPDMVVTPRAAEAIGLAFHELATNAVKHGALSGANGTVTIEWTQIPGSKDLRLRWIERGGPEVTPPTRKGFGHIVCERVVAQLLGGEVSMEFAPDGACWQLRVPADHLVRSG